MSEQKNINSLIDKSFENFNFLPQKLFLEDIDQGIFDFLRGRDLSLQIEDNTKKEVPMVFLTQEKWAEFQKNWRAMRDENNEEISYPFMTLRRTSVTRGTSPARFTIPNKKAFTFVKVPNFDGILKGYTLYKIPQPPVLDVHYDLRFFTHYMQDLNKFYEMFIGYTFSDGQAYTTINGYWTPIRMGEPSEDNTVDEVDVDRRFSAVLPLQVHTKLVDPTQFEKVNTVTKIAVRITEL